MLFDWYTCIVLTVVLLVDGMRRVPAGGIVLRRTLGGDWHIARAPEEKSRLQFVSVLAPLTLHLVIEPNVSSKVPTPRLTTGGGWVLALRLLGCFQLVVLLAGLPWLMANLGGFGFVLAAITLMIVSTATAIAATVALRSAQLSWRDALQTTMWLAWPFSAPAAAERVIERSMRDVHPLRAIHTLLPPHSFARWVRPLAYDALQTGSLPNDVLTDEEARLLVSTPPDDLLPGERFCRRCGCLFIEHVNRCADCDIELQSQTLASLTPL